jgi:hypothetical protein
MFRGVSSLAETRAIPESSSLEWRRLVRVFVKLLLSGGHVRSCIQLSMVSSTIAESVLNVRMTKAAQDGWLIFCYQQLPL